MYPIPKKRAGFTLVEIMIVVAIIALLAAIALPNFMRARKRSQYARTMSDLRVIDSAVDQYSLESGKAAGAPVSWSVIKSFLKSGSKLYTTSASPLGDAYGSAFTVDSTPKIPANTYNALSDVAPLADWAPFSL